MLKFGLEFIYSIDILKADISVHDLRLPLEFMPLVRVWVIDCSLCSFLLPIKEVVLWLFLS
jgi:hypothetical protein